MVRLDLTSETKTHRRHRLLHGVVVSFLKHPLIVLVTISAGLGHSLALGKVYSYHLVMVFGLLIFFVRRVKRKDFYCWGLVITGLLFWSFLSPSLWRQPIQALKYIVPIFAGLGGTILLFLKIRSISSLKAAVGSFIIIELFNAVFGLLEIYGIYHLPVKTNWSEMTDPKILLLSQQFPTGFSFNPNHFGVTMLIPIVFFIAWILTRRKGWKPALFMALPLVVYALLRTGSRGSVGGMILLFLAAIMWSQRKKLLRLVTFAVMFLGCALYITLIIPAEAIEEVFPGLSHSVSLQTMFSEPKEGSSVAIRLAYITEARQAFLETSGLGLGPGGLTSLHNLYFEVLANAGLIGIMLLVWLFTWLIRRSWRYSLLQRSFLGTVSLGCFLFWIGFSFAVVSLSSAIYFLPMYLMIGISMATFNLQIQTDRANIGKSSPVLALE